MRLSFCASFFIMTLLTMEDVGFILVCDPCSVQFSEPQAGGGSHRGDEVEKPRDI